MPYRKIKRLIPEPRACACGQTAFVSVHEKHLAIVDREDIAILSSGKWTVQTDGALYAIRFCLGRKMWLHREVMGDPPGALIDHENRFGLDCRKDNLREADCSQNQANAKGRPGTSRFKGVHYKKTHKKWSALLSWRGTRHFLGYYDTEEDAAKAYNAAAISHHQSFAHLNHI